MFLYGMQMMSQGLEDAAGDRMEKILAKLTANRFLGVAVGAIITALIQSSSATTVMAVGFVNSGMMTLQQAVWIIMGANIGTTITGQLLTLDIGAVAPFVAFLGVAMIVFVKSEKCHHIGMVLGGFGMLFIGMDTMGAAMKPLQEMEEFVSLMTTFSNPVLGILAGAIFTAVIQSSSASVGILQTLAGNGLIPFSSAVFVLFGQNIGTCITAVLAAIGTNRSAKRTTIIHLMFNMIGTAIFTVVCILFPFANIIENLTPGNPTAQIANMHTTFNIVTTILLIPFGTYLAKLATKILPETKEEKGEVSLLHSLNTEFVRNRTNLGSDAIHMDALRQEVERVISLAGKNVEKSFQAILEQNSAIVKETEETESTINAIKKDISKYVSKVLVSSSNDQHVISFEQYFLITSNAERIGDHATNICDYVEILKKNNIIFSKDAKNEIVKMQSITKEVIDKVLTKNDDTENWLIEIRGMEQQIDDMTERYRERHLERMRKGLCSEEACMLYSQILTDFERIGDHVLNIAKSYNKIYKNS